MNIVSACCHRGIVNDIRLEYPTGGRTWAIPYKVERCESCGRDIDDVGTEEECEECGLVGCKGNCEQIEWGLEADDERENEISAYCCY